MSMGDFPESLSRRILVGIILVGRLGVILLHLRLSTVEGVADGEGLNMLGELRKTFRRFSERHGYITSACWGAPKDFPEIFRKTAVYHPAAERVVEGGSKHAGGFR